MSKIISTLIVVIGIAYLLFRIFDINPVALIKNQPTATPTPDAWLPSGWTQISSSDNEIKLEKTVESGLKPQIVFDKSTLETGTDFTAYTSRLISGAKSAIPSLKYTQDDLSDSSRTLSGFYYNQKKKVFITQKIFQKDNSVYTLTASYSDESGKSEITSIFDSIVSRRLPN